MRMACRPSSPPSPTGDGRRAAGGVTRERANPDTSTCSLKTFALFPRDGLTGQTPRRISRSGTMDTFYISLLTSGKGLRRCRLFGVVIGVGCRRTHSRLQKWDDTLPLRLNPSLCLSVPPQLTLRRVASKLSDPHLHGGRQTRPGEIDTIGLGERLHHYVSLPAKTPAVNKEYL